MNVTIILLYLGLIIAHLISKVVNLLPPHKIYLLFEINEYIGMAITNT